MGRFFRILGMSIAIVAILAGALGALYFVGKSKFNPAPPDTSYPPPADAREAQRQDIDYFGKLVAIDRAYSPEARAQAERRLEALADGPVLDRGHLRVALMRITALADNGHTSLHSKKPTRPAILPIRLAAFSDGIFVMRTAPGNADLLGAQVVAIDGHPLEEVIRKLEELRGGTEPWRRDYAQWVLNSSEILYGLGIAPAPDRSTWTFRTRTGGTATRTLAGAQPGYDDPAPDIWRWSSPEPVKDDKQRWAAFTPPDWKAPLTLEEPDKLFRAAHVPGSCAMLVQLRANAGDGIGAFLKATEAEIAASKPCAVILDNRVNGGGDYTNTSGFASRLPSLARHIYVLTGPETFSAGITTTVFVKQASAPGQTVLLGEGVGDRLTFWAEGGEGCLPHAPFCFRYATGMHDYAHACRDWNKCFWLNWLYPARTDDLKPAETIHMAFADYLAGRDPAFDRALALTAKIGGAVH
ncbi:MAG: hypothetical protein JOZ72_15210 [Alphaproteobacteria bacterium]|nr:hypothetical protein [Alphaproteobacteria bacterium]